MAKYEAGDIVTYWFVVYSDPNTGSRYIKAFSDNKALVKAYMDFHKCPDFTIKGMTDKIEKIIDIVNANANDEIQVINIATRDREAKKGRNKLKLVCVPMTQTERMFLDDDSTNFLNSIIHYAYINSAIPYLKNKYRRILEDIMLPDVISKVINGQTTRKMKYLDVDQLMVMLKIPNANFGL